MQKNVDLTWVHCTSIFGLIGAVDRGRTLHLAQVFLTSMFTRTTCKIIVDVLHHNVSTNDPVRYGEQSVSFRHQYVAECSPLVDARPERGSEILVKNALFIVSIDSSFTWKHFSFLRNNSS